MREPDQFISTNQGDRAIVQWLNQLFYDCGAYGVSDIHIEDEEDGCWVRVRQGNDLEQVGQRLDPTDAQNVQEKIRARCKMPMIDIRAPRDGRMRLRFDYGALDVRVNAMPTVFGTSITCRLLDERNARRRLDDIYMADSVRSAINTIIREPNGLFLVTGPTGSGKTSTLYAIINELLRPEVKIITIEDPVEYIVRGLTQTSLDHGVTFSDALRAAVRQDPDILLVGEIRDSETALIAIRAAMTGHLVLATLHTNDAPSAVTRLLDLGADPFTLGASLRGVLAQRLVRRLSDPDHLAVANEAEALFLRSHGLPTDGYFGSASPVHTSSEAYTGRLPVMELLMVDEAMQKAIVAKALNQIQREAQRQPQYLTLAEAGVALARQGLTTLDEIQKISGGMQRNLGSARIGERLKQLGLITEGQLTAALQKQATYGENQRLGDLLINLGLVNKEQLHAALTT